MDQSGAIQRGKVISAVLDAIFETMEIDPAILSPDSPLSAEFGLSFEEIEKVLTCAAQKLRLAVQNESMAFKDASAKDLVEFLLGCVERSERQAS